MFGLYLLFVIACVVVFLLAQSSFPGRLGRVLRVSAQCLSAIMIVGMLIFYPWSNRHRAQTQAEHQENLRPLKQETQQVKIAEDQFINEFKEPLTLAVECVYKKHGWSKGIRSLRLSFLNPEDVDFIGSMLRRADKKNKDRLEPDKSLNADFFVPFWEDVLEPPMEVEGNKWSDPWRDIRRRTPHMFMKIRKEEAKKKLFRELAEATPQALEMAREKMASYEAELATLRPMDRWARELAIFIIKVKMRRAVLQDYQGIPDHGKKTVK